MKNVTMIAAIGKNYELGKNNGLIWYLPEDLKFFKEHTMGKDVVMGLNTLKSLPRKLKYRHYVVLTTHTIEADEDWTVVHSIEELLSYIESQEKEVMIIGGASLYRQMLPFADRLLLTEIDAEDKDADVFFPEIQRDKWECHVLSEMVSDENISYKHLEYCRK